MINASDSHIIPVHKLIGVGGPASAYQVAKSKSIQGPTHRGLFKVDTLVATYETHEQAENAIRTLQAAGVDMRTLSIAGKNTRVVEQVTGFYSAGDRMLRWGVRGAFWGGVRGLLFDSVFFAIPGIGPVLLAGPLVAWVVAVHEGAIVFGDISALGAGLLSVGIPKQSAVKQTN